MPVNFYAICCYRFCIKILRKVKLGTYVTYRICSVICIRLVLQSHIGITISKTTCIYEATNLRKSHEHCLFPHVNLPGNNGGFTVILNTELVQVCQRLSWSKPDACWWKKQSQLQATPPAIAELREKHRQKQAKSSQLLEKNNCKLSQKYLHFLVNCRYLQPRQGKFDCNLAVCQPALCRYNFAQPQWVFACGAEWFC